LHGSGMTHESGPIGKGRRGTFVFFGSLVMAWTLARGVARVRAMANTGKAGVSDRGARPRG
jgi:hypothetical protein